MRLGAAAARQVQLESGEAKGGYALIPFAREIVTMVDLEERVMVVDPPAGLLELARVRTHPRNNEAMFDR